MDVFELNDLSAWYRAQYRALKKAYGDLQTALNNNATQSTKVPIEEPLATLTSLLTAMNLGELSVQQLELLDKLQVQQYIGPLGARWVEGVVKAEAYDPVTTEQSVSSALSLINSANEKLTAYASAMDGLELERTELAGEADRIIVRVGFKNDASIKNIKDWKSSADDWLLIVRGLALINGEAPENTKVVGAATGSIIIVLSVTYGISKLLATITKHITGAAKDILTLQIAVEDLRQKKILTKTMEEEFARLKSEARTTVQQEIEDEIRKIAPKADGEKTSALGKSIQKLLKFGEDGGDIDFVAPTPPADPELDDVPAEMLATIQSVRNVILEYQAEREAVKLLSANQNPPP